MVNRNLEHGGIKRTVIIAAAVVLVVILAIVAFFVWKNAQSTETQNDTTATNEVTKSVNRDTFSDNEYKNWQTYTSEKYGFTIQYPADWIVVPETDIDSLYIRNKKPINEGLAQYPEGYINLRVYQTGDEEYSLVGQTAKSWYDILGTSTVSNGAVSYNPEDVTPFELNGRTAKHLKSVTQNTDEDVLLLDNNKLYTINISPYGALSDQTVQKIVASFTLAN